MKTIVLSNKNNNIHQTIYVTIAKRWINIKGEKALLEDGVWDEYPIEEIANVKIGSLIYKMSDKEAIKSIVERKIFDSNVLDMLRTFKLGY